MKNRFIGRKVENQKLLMGLVVVRGRTLTAAEFTSDEDLRQMPDRPTPAAMAELIRRAGPYVINEAFAKHYVPNEDPLSAASPVVGIVRDVKLLSLKHEVGPLMFVPARWPQDIHALQVRTVGDPQVIQPAIREVLHAINPRSFRASQLSEKPASATSRKNGW